MTKAIAGMPAANRNFAKDYECIRKESKLYPGEWIAIKNGELIGHNVSRKNLQQDLAGKLKGALFFKVEE